jgi:putative two-component system response regulator
MPIMNGFEVLEWVAAAKHIPKLQPIVLSASYRIEDVNRAKHLGAVDYLVKPISPAMALATINALAAPASAS